MPKKDRKLMPKGFKMRPKWMPKSLIFHVFSKKVKNRKSRSRCSESMGSGHLKLHEKSIQEHRKINARKRHAKSIADAERHRRTPWTPADESKSIRGKKSADIGDTGEKKKPKNMPKSLKYRPNGDQNRREVEVAFLKRLPSTVSGGPP